MHQLDLRGMWSSGEVTILVQQSHGIPFCLVYLRLGSKAMDFDSPSNHSLGRDLVCCKAIQGHLEKKSLLEEFPNGPLETWEAGLKLFTGERKCVQMCEHTLILNIRPSRGKAWVPQANQP